MGIERQIRIPNSTLSIQPLNASMENPLDTLPFALLKARTLQRALMVFLTDGHLLDHVCLSRSTGYTRRGACTSLLLEDLPELQLLAGFKGEMKDHTYQL
jgi:hypothetical protein